MRWLESSTPLARAIARMRRVTTYRQFLDAHQSRANRVGHLTALVVGIVVGVTAWLIFGWPWSAIALPIIGIGGGLSHLFFEGNSPAFFKRPWEIPLLLVYDTRMGFATMCDWKVASNVRPQRFGRLRPSDLEQQKTSNNATDSSKPKP